MLFYGVNEAGHSGTMKDLTHYFNSPKEELPASKDEQPEIVVDSAINVVTNEKSPASKKRKVYLSRSKGKGAQKGNKLQNSDGNDKSLQPESTDEANSDSLKTKKRKLKEDNSNSLKKNNPNKPTKSYKKVCRDITSKNACNLSDSSIIIQENCAPKNLKTQITNDKAIQIDSSNSCEESIFQEKKTKHPKRILESDEETTLDQENNQSQSKSITEECLKQTDSQPKTNQEKCISNETSPSNARNSLFGYFNKVDKETALKQKNEKIKVEALIHLPPSEDKKIRKSLDKPIGLKQKKQKKKLHLDNSDTIEVISSENIVDENSSVTANSSQTPSNLELIKDVSNGPPATPIAMNKTASNEKPKTTNLASIFLPKKTEKSVIHEESGGFQHSEDIICTETKSTKNNKQPRNKPKKINKKFKEQSDVEQSEKASRSSSITESEVFITKNNDSNFLNSNISKMKDSAPLNSECKMVKSLFATDKSTVSNKDIHKKSINTSTGLATETVSLSKKNDFSLVESDPENSNEDKLLQKCTVVIETFSESTNAQATLKLNSSKKNQNQNTPKSKKLLKPETPVITESLVNNSIDKTEKTPKNKNSSKEELTPLETDFKLSEKVDLKTPRNKPVTLNGYFTPKTRSSSSAKNKSSEDRKNLNKTTPSWVMKVCLSSTEKPSMVLGSKENSMDCFEELSQLSSESPKYSTCVKEETESNQTTLNILVNSSAPAVADAAPTLVEGSEQKEDSQFTLNLRPKRSCRLKIGKLESPKSPAVVDEDSSETSQGAKTKRRSMSRSAKKPKTIEIDDDDVVEIKKNGNTETPKPVKIWPFFNKKEARQQKQDPIDEEKLKAKQLFLESGVPEIIKRKVENNKNEIVIGSPAPFPTVSHVTQSDNKERIDVDINYRLPVTRSPSPPLPELKSVSFLTADNPEDPDIPVFERPGNVKAVLKLLKEEEPKTEVKALYKRLKEYRGGGSSDIWTEVYKPTNAADMVGNSESINKLKSWLEKLKNRRTKEGSDSSGDEFVNSDSDDESRSNNNMAVLSGPCGCGKTSAVYAVARELDCKVLEINASCNRSGKRVLAEFSESTQSHQVERAQTANDFFNNQLKGSSKKKKKWKLSKEAKSEKTSLILVEDADLLFTDVDEGFMSSLSSLAAASKRPIVLITNHNRNPHLERFQSDRLLQLTFSRPKAAKLGLWLRLVALVEGVIVSRAQAEALVSWAGCDVRRCLLQLQLMVHSNNSEIKRKVTEAQLWWLWPDRYDLKYELPSLVVPEETQQSADSSDKQLILKQLDSIARTTKNLAYSDVLSTYTSQVGSSADGDPCPMSWRPRWRDSTSLALCQDSPRSGITEELLEWLAQDVSREWSKQAESGERVGQTLQESRWLSVLRQGEQKLLSGVSTGLHTDHRSVACDYLPTLRELARAERIRLANYTRRADRFFNYLQGLGITASKPCRDFLCDVFS